VKAQHLITLDTTDGASTFAGPKGGNILDAQ